MIEPGAVTAYLGAIWELTPDEKTFAESVHRLTDIGAVVTQVAKGTSREGFDAEWRRSSLTTVEGDRINRCEFFDEADLDAALARFDELRQPAGRLENAASQMTDRFWSDSPPATGTPWRNGYRTTSATIAVEW